MNTQFTQKYDIKIINQKLMIYLQREGWKGWEIGNKVDRMKV